MGMWTDHLANKADELEHWQPPIKRKLFESWANGLKPIFIQHLPEHLEAFEDVTERPEPIGGLRVRAVSPAQARKPPPPPRYNQGAIDEVWRRTVDFMNGVLATMDTEALFPAAPTEPKAHAKAKHVFLGHGRADDWEQLASFLQHGLGLEVEEFNWGESPAGKTNSEHVEDLLSRSHFAFLVYTGEDEQPDGTTRARENVVEESGRCVNQFGPKRAIVVQEIGCNIPSNLDGPNPIRFPAGKIHTVFNQMRGVLEREGML